jgi:predicted nucleic acid-binding protein
MKTRLGLIAFLLAAIVLHLGIGLVCDPDFENVS